MVAIKSGASSCRRGSLLFGAGSTCWCSLYPPLGSKVVCKRSTAVAWHTQARCIPRQDDGLLSLPLRKGRKSILPMMGLVHCNSVNRQSRGQSNSRHRHRARDSGIPVLLRLRQVLTVRTPAPPRGSRVLHPLKGARDWPRIEQTTNSRVLRTHSRRSPTPLQPQRTNRFSHLSYIPHNT